MRKSILYIIIGVAALLSCETEHSDSGNLDGFWQMTSIDTLTTGGSVDMRESGITWAFQGRLLELRDWKKNNVDVVMSFHYANSWLRLYAPYQVDRDHGDYPIDQVGYISGFGVNALEETFFISRLSSGAMVLESEQLRLHFRKY